MDNVEKQNRLEELLEGMLLQDITISARAVCRRSPDVFPHPSAITTVARRRELLEMYVAKQDLVRDRVGSGLSKEQLEIERTATRQRIADLERNQVLLATGLKAAILAVTTIGGFKMWAAHYREYEAAISLLKTLDALPSAQVLPGPTGAR